jgi:hypothetical protein
VIGELRGVKGVIASLVELRGVIASLVELRDITLLVFDSVIVYYSVAV